jgi:hypothetical protein
LCKSVPDHHGADAIRCDRCLTDPRHRVLVYGIPTALLLTVELRTMMADPVAPTLLLLVTVSVSVTWVFAPLMKMPTPLAVAVTRVSGAPARTNCEHVSY